VRHLIVFSMLAAIDLNHEAPVEAHVIDNIVADGMLPAETQTFEPATPKGMPKLTLSLTHDLAHGTRALVGHGPIVQTLRER